MWLNNMELNLEMKINNTYKTICKISDFCKVLGESLAAIEFVYLAG